MSYSDAQLQDAWDRYVVMREAEVIYFTHPESAGFDAGFAATLGYIYQNRLFGFANYSFPAAGNMSFQGRVTSK
jgi:hypothetical protein